jgi:Zn-finger nucleic acid-binding protein
VNCPVDDTVLVMSERQGVEIDYCPQCRGVWLDRGELDKILERAAGDVAPARDPGPTPDYSRQPERSDRPPTKKKKSSFLSEIFEFGE